MVTLLKNRKSSVGMAFHELEQVSKVFGTAKLYIEDIECKIEDREKYEDRGLVTYTLEIDETTHIRRNGEFYIHKNVPYDIMGCVLQLPGSFNRKNKQSYLFTHNHVYYETPEYKHEDVYEQIIVIIVYNRGSVDEEV